MSEARWARASVVCAGDWMRPCAGEDFQRVKQARPDRFGNVIVEFDGGRVYAYALDEQNEGR